MNDQSNVINEEISIDLITLFRHIIGKWKVILCVSIFAAVLGGLIGMAKTGRSTNDLPTPELNLTDEQITDAEMHYSQIRAYDRVIDEQRRFNDESYIMSLDPSKAVVYDMQYLIETDIYNSAEAYENDLLSEDDYNMLAGFLGKDVGKAGLDESASLKTDMSNLSYPNDKEKSYKLLLTISVIGPNEDTCDKMLSVIDSAIEKKTELLNEQGLLIECTLLCGEYSKSAGSLVTALQQERINALGSVITSRSNYFNNIVSKINGTEKDYLDNLLSDETNEPQTSANQARISWEFTIKYLFIGLFVGLFLTLCVITVAYIYSGRLHSSEELAENYRIPVMNAVSSDLPDTLDILVEELNNLVETKDMDKIFIATEKEVTGAAEIADKIADRISRNVSAFVGGIEPGVCDVKQLVMCDGVFIIPIIDITKTKAIRDLLQICNRNGRHVIGSSPIKK